MDGGRGKNKARRDVALSIDIEAVAGARVTGPDRKETANSIGSKGRLLLTAHSRGADAKLTARRRPIALQNLRVHPFA